MKRFYKEDAVEENGVLITWDNLGEGLKGEEYNPNDRHDRPVLRFTVFSLNNDGGWDAVEDGSCCTLVDADTGQMERRILLDILMDQIYMPFKNGLSIKKICEKLSWMDKGWVKTGIPEKIEKDIWEYIIPPKSFMGVPIPEVKTEDDFIVTIIARCRADGSVRQIVIANPFFDNIEIRDVISHPQADFGGNGERGWRINEGEGYRIFLTEEVIDDA